MLADIIRQLLSDPSNPVSTEELAERVIAMIPQDRLEEALRESLPPLVVRERSNLNRQLFREVIPGDDPAREPEADADESRRFASLKTGGVRTASARTALLMENELLMMSITGRGRQVVRLANARSADLYAEIHASEAKGRTYLHRAAIFQDMQAEMARMRVETPAGLPGSSRREYAMRMRDLLR